MNPNRYKLGPQLSEEEAYELDPKEVVCLTFFHGDRQDSLVYQVIGTVAGLSDAPIWDVPESVRTNIKRVFYDDF